MQQHTNLKKELKTHFNIAESNTAVLDNSTKISNRNLHTTCQSLIIEIIAATKYSMARISAETNIPLITLRRLRTGITKEPRSAAFHRIFSLYCKVCLCKNITNT